MFDEAQKFHSSALLLLPILALLGGCEPQKDTEQTSQTLMAVENIQPQPQPQQGAGSQPSGDTNIASYSVDCDPVGCRVASKNLQFLVRTQQNSLAIDPLYFNAEPEPRFAGAKYTETPIQIDLIQHRHSEGNRIRYIIGMQCPHVGFYSQSENVFYVITLDEMMNRIADTEQVSVHMSGIFEGDALIGIYREIPTAPLIAALQVAVERQRTSPSLEVPPKRDGLALRQPEECDQPDPTR